MVNSTDWLVSAIAAILDPFGFWSMLAKLNFETVKQGEDQKLTEFQSNADNIAKRQFMSSYGKSKEERQIEVKRMEQRHLKEYQHKLDEWSKQLSWALPGFSATTCYDAIAEASIQEFVAYRKKLRARSARLLASLNQEDDEDEDSEGEQEDVGSDDEDEDSEGEQEDVGSDEEEPADEDSEGEQEVVGPHVEEPVKVSEEEESNDEEPEDEEEWFGPEDAGKEELKKVKLAFTNLRRKIMVDLLESTLKNPLFKVKKDIMALADILLELDKLSDYAPEDIITRALRNGVRDPSQPEERLRKDQAVLKVNPNPRKGTISKNIDELTEIVVRLYHPKKIEKDFFLKGSFGPVRTETNPSPGVKVKGRIPVSLNGLMIRNGPNPVFDPVAHYKWLDGDSMVHAVQFKDGKATYVSHYVKTSRFKQEQVFEKAEFLQYGDLHGEFGLFMACMQLLKEKLGVVDMSYGWSNANTGVVNHNEMLMILQDWDHPYVLNVQENGGLGTIGIADYNKKLVHSFTPHPKKDPHTGELFILGASYTFPYGSFTIVSKDGAVSDPVALKTLAGPTYMHDLGLTDNYVIIMDLPYFFNPKKMLEQGTWIYSFDPTKKSRFGVLPRYEKSDEKMKWFEFDDTFLIFHVGNSWEEDENTLVLISVLGEPKIKQVSESETTQDPANRVDNPYSCFSRDASGTPCEIFFKPAHIFAGRNENESFTHFKLYKMTFNLKTGECQKHKLSESHFEYPKVNENYIGRKSKYVYLSEMNDDFAIKSITKYDLEWDSELKINFPETEFGSEVAFVPRQFSTPLEEDDGYLTTFVHDEKNSKSFAYIIYAKKMEFLVKIELSNKVPYGFHATFVTEDELPKKNNSITA